MQRIVWVGCSDQPSTCVRVTRRRQTTVAVACMPVAGVAIFIIGVINPEVDRILYVFVLLQLCIPFNVVSLYKIVLQ